VKAAGNAGEIMVALAKEVPNSGGMVSWFTGDNDMDDFGEQILYFGSYMASFSRIVAGNIDTDAVKAAGNAGEIMVTLAKKVPNSGGMVSWFTGDNDMDDFGEQVLYFGSYMASFSRIVAGNIDTEAVEAAANAGKIMAAMTDTIPNMGGLEWFDGNKGDKIKDFGEQICYLGYYLADFYDTIQGKTNLGNVYVVQRMVEVFADMTDTIPDVGLFNSPFSDFGAELSAFGDYLQRYYSSIQNIEFSKLAEVTDEIASLIDLTNAAEGIEDGTLTDLGESLSTIAESGIKEFVDAFGEHDSEINDAVIHMLSDAGDAVLNNQNLVTDKMLEVMTAIANTITTGTKNVQTAVKTMMGRIGEGIRSNTRPAQTAVQNLMSSIISKVHSYAGKFRTEGVNMAQGLILGIQSQQGSVASAGSALSSLALKASKEAVDSNSPAKKYIQLGIDSGEGLAQGIRQSTKRPVEASVNMVSEALSKAGNTMRRETKGLFTNVATEIADFGGGLVSSLGDSIREKLPRELTDVAQAVEGQFTEWYGSITGDMTQLLEAAGADTSNVDYSWLNGLTTEQLRAQQKVEEEKLRNAQNNAAGYSNALSGEASAVNNLAGSYSNLSEVKETYYDATISRISQTYQYLIEHLPDGFALGLQNEVTLVENSMITSIEHIHEVADKGIEIWKDWVDEKQYYNDISLKEELAGWEYLQAQYAEGSEERIEIDREVYRLRNEIVEASYQFSLDWIEREKTYNRLSTEEEIAAYERMQSRYMEGSEERMEIDKKLYELRNQLIEDSYQSEIDWMEEEMFYNRMSAEQQLAFYQTLKQEYAEYGDYVKKINREIYTLQNQLMSDYYQSALDWIEEEKYYDRLSLVDELAAYKKIQKQTVKGSEERKKMDREIYRLEKEIYEAQKQYTADVQRVEEEAAQKRLDLEQEYADKVTSINDKLASDIERLNDQYESSLKSRENSLYSAYGLFDEVKEKEEVSGQELLNNLQGQVEEFNEWQTALSHLSARGVDAELISELEEMGPSAIAQIKALEKLTDSELNRYVGLWAVKHAQARQQAISELEDLRVETQENIAQLRVDADRELSDYCVVWQDRMGQIDTDANAELAQLRKDFEEKVGLIKNDTEEETQEMVDVVQQIMEEAGWGELGQDIVDELTSGVEERTPAFRNAMLQMALDGMAAMSQALGLDGSAMLFGNTLSGAVQSVSDYLNAGIEAMPAVTPVVDYSEKEKQNPTQWADTSVKQLGDLASVMMAAQANAGVNANNTERQSVAASINIDEIVARLDALNENMTDMTDAVTHQSIVLDSGVLVGQTASRMDSQLGLMQEYQERGI